MGRVSSEGTHWCFPAPKSWFDLSFVSSSCNTVLRTVWFGFRSRESLTGSGEDGCRCRKRVEGPRGFLREEGRRRDERQPAKNRWIFCFPCVHPSIFSVNHDPTTNPRLSFRSTFSFVRCSFIVCAFSLGVQAWLTEIHEYAQQDVVVMLLGNKVRPRCQRVGRPADRWTHGGREGEVRVEGGGV